MAPIMQTPHSIAAAVTPWRIAQSKPEAFQRSQMITRNRGFGLMEILVGLVVGLISMIVIMQVYSTFEDQKRATTTGSDAQSNGALALYYLEREIRGAGNAIAEGTPGQSPPIAGCTTDIYDSTYSYLIPNTTTAASITAPASTLSHVKFAPAVITNGVGNATDSITIVYGTSMISAPYTLGTPYIPTDTQIGLTSTAGIKQNDMVLMIDQVPGAPSNYMLSNPCKLMQVTAAPAVNSIQVTPNRFNGGTPLPNTTFVTNPLLYDLGQVNIVTYRVDANHDLVAETTQLGWDPTTNANVINRVNSSPLAPNIVNMQIQYGIDNASPAATLASCNQTLPGITNTVNDSDGVVDFWTDAVGVYANGATTPSVLDLRRVRAVRIGLVARTGIKASGKAGDLCNSTAPVIHWDDTGPYNTMTPDLSDDTNWACYHYKTFQTIIPIRNLIWSSTLNPLSSGNCK